MSREYFEHLTQLGERWDLIAFRYYGDATLIAPILRANPEFSDTGRATPLVLPHGSKIRVPVVAESEVRKQQLPPWKRK